MGIFLNNCLKNLYGFSWVVLNLQNVLRLNDQPFSFVHIVFELPCLCNQSSCFPSIRPADIDKCEAEVCHCKVAVQLDCLSEGSFCLRNVKFIVQFDAFKIRSVCFGGFCCHFCNRFCSRRCACPNYRGQIISHEEG